jgi:hypothetical protein
MKKDRAKNEHRLSPARILDTWRPCGPEIAGRRSLFIIEKGYERVLSYARYVSGGSVLICNYER